LVGVGDALALEESYFAIVVCFSIFLELVRILLCVIICYSSQGYFPELGGKYKGIHPHLSLHHFMLKYFLFNKGLLREV
jgi:hypothetical protein